MIIISGHYFLVFLGMLHAVCGQYFYFPFIVENTEIHIGKRPSNSIYSGGQTAWQDEKQANIYRKFPKLWYGWFGSGNKENWITGPLKEFLLSLFRRLFKK